jgi:hypothetical protein
MQQQTAKQRIDGLISTSLLWRFLDTVNDIVDDVQKEEPFEREDVIKYLESQLRTHRGAHD